MTSSATAQFPAVDAAEADKAAVTLDYRTPGTPAVDADRPGELRKKAVSGGALTVGTMLALNAQRFAVNLIVVRLLAPADFGLAALLNVVLAGLHLFSDVGIGPAVIQSPRGDEDKFLRTAWTIQIGRGAALFAAGCLLAWPLSLFYGEPRLVYLLPLVASTALLEGFRSTGWVRLMRHMRFATISLLELCRGVLSGIVMVTWAWFSPSVLALLVPTILGTVFDVVISHFVMRDRRDRIGWDREAAAGLFNFGKWVFISTALTFGATSLDRLVLPKLFVLDLVGVYQIALMLATIPTIALLSLSSRIVFPALSRVAKAVKETPGPDEAAVDRFRHAFSRVRRTLLSLSAFALAGMVAAGPSLIGFAYPAKVGFAADLVQVLALAGWFHLLEASTGSAMLALGHPRWTALSTGVKVVLLFALVPLGAYYEGLYGATLAIAAADVGRYAASLFGARRLPVPLHPLRTDIPLTLGLVASAAGGLLLASLVDSDVAGFFLSSGFVTLCWAWPLWRVARDARR